MSEGPTILIVDDEAQIQRFLKPSLKAAGFEVLQALSAGEAIKISRQKSPQLLIIDLGLPDMDGKDLIAELRQWLDAPIIVLSVRDREAEKIAALDAGADDYVNKPFGIGELLARIRSALRPRNRIGEAPSAVNAGDLTIDAAGHKVMRGAEQLHLTPKEFELLLLLARHAGRVITHRQLLTTVWGPAHTADTQYLRVFIGQLRQKVEADPSEPKLILTVPGVGYRLAEAD